MEHCSVCLPAMSVTYQSKEVCVLHPSVNIGKPNHSFRVLSAAASSLQGAKSESQLRTE